MEEGQAKCYACGAERPRARRSQARAASEEAAGRRTSSQRPAAPEPAPRKSGSMPQQRHPDGRAQGKPPVRMVRRHEYEAILPETSGYDHVNWLRLCLIAALCVVILVAGVFFFLRGTAQGQRMLAAGGREASAEAYHELGRSYLADGMLSSAVWAMEIAQQKNPDDLETLIDLGKAYMANGDGAQAEVALVRAINLWPAHPEPYRLLINNMLTQSRNSEALQVLQMAMENNDDAYFSTQYKQLLPEMPTVSDIGKTYTTEMTITLAAEDSAVIYYTLNGKDPKDPEEGLVYSGPLLLEDGASWKLRAVAFRDGMYSLEQVQTYIINKPSPDQPKASLPTNTYSSVRTVSLRPGGKDVVDIYYTIDGTSPGDRDGPSPNAKLFVEGQPITLRIGKTQLRAIAYNVEGKASNELTVEYVCEGKTKATFSDKDAVSGLKLGTTTRANFEKTYGAPQQEYDDGSDVQGTYIRCVYPFGFVTYLDRGNDREPVLMELSTTSTAFSGPRGTSVGMRMEEVIDAFRDNGGEPNAQGQRNLYVMTDGRLAQLTPLEGGGYQISYYYPVEAKKYLELTFWAQDGLITQMDWFLYTTR